MVKLNFAVVSLFIIFTISSCSDNITDPFDGSSYDTLIAWNYSDNFYFADTSYRNIFESYYSDSSGLDINVISANSIIPDSFEVWVQSDQTNTDIRLAFCYTGLYEKPINGYPDSLMSPVFFAGKSFLGYFRKLSESEYYLNPESGLIGLKNNIPHSFHIAISYKTQSGSKYGQFSNEISSDDTLILKMIKSNIVNPVLAPEIWDYKVKSIYSFNSQIPNYPSNFDFRIYYETGGNYDEFLLPDYSFIRVFRLDRFFEPVNKFDYVKNVTVIPELNSVIIPFLEPFNERIKKFTNDASYYAPLIYNSPKTVAASSNSPNRYKLVGRIKK